MHIFLVHLQFERPTLHPKHCYPCVLNYSPIKINGDAIIAFSVICLSFHVVTVLTNFPDCINFCLNSLLASMEIIFGSMHCI